MDHLRSVTQSDSYNGIAASRLTSIFGCLIFCSCDVRIEHPPSGTFSKDAINPLDPDQATRTLGMLLDNWPPRGWFQFYEFILALAFIDYNTGSNHEHIG